MFNYSLHELANGSSPIKKGRGGIWMFFYRKRYQISQDGRIKKTWGNNAAGGAQTKFVEKKGKHNLTSFMD
jgi:hypothetical protein